MLGFPEGVLINPSSSSSLMPASAFILVSIMAKETWNLFARLEGLASAELVAERRGKSWTQLIYQDDGMRIGTASAKTGNGLTFSMDHQSKSKRFAVLSATRKYPCFEKI